VCLWRNRHLGTPNATAEMTATIPVITLAEIEPIPFAGLTGDIIKTTNAGASFSTISGNTAGTSPGTLGAIRVKTNSTNWDVKMRTKYGGRLQDESKAVPVEVPGAPDIWGVPGPSTTTYTDGEYLTYNTGAAAVAGTDELGVIARDAGKATDPDTVQLQVAVGYAQTGKMLGSPANLEGTLFALGGPTAPLAPALIDFAALKDSDVAPADANAISLAEVLSGHTVYTGSTITGISDRPWTGTGVSNIEDNGFGVPNHNRCTATDDCRNEEYFFINVGIRQDKVDAIGGNIGGDYSETFYFDFVASF